MQNLLRVYAKIVENLLYLTNTAVLLALTSKKSSQNSKFFKTVPANFGGNKEKYLPLKKVKICSALMYFGPHH